MNTRLTFSYIDEGMPRELIMSLPRSRIKFAASNWASYRRICIRMFEMIQRDITIFVQNSAQLSSKEIGYSEIDQGERQKEDSLQPKWLHSKFYIVFVTHTIIQLSAT